jgi:uncharacterized protein (DUF2336 family)
MMIDPATPESLSYEQARDIAAHAESAQRETLARRADVPAEVLYFLASDDETPVRRVVAANTETPALGNLVLAGDHDDEVRRALALKLSRHGRYSGIGALQHRARAIADLSVEKLAGDGLTDIRAAMSEILREDANATRSVIRALALDEATIVALPVLESSPVLTAEDLLEVIAGSPPDAKLAAIARRPLLDERVASMLVASRNVPAIAHMLGKSNADVQETTLDRLIDSAAAELGWQEPPSFRRDVSETTVQTLVDRVQTQIEALFPDDQNLPAGARSTIQAMVQKRLEKGGEKIRGADAAGFAAEAGSEIDAAYLKAQSLEEERLLDEGTLRVFLLTDHDEDLIAGLAVKSGLPVRTVLHVVAAQSARAMCALAWKAGLSAAFAHDLQLRLASVSSQSAITPAPGGHYALDEEEMLWQLDMFGSADSPL